jgi:hypothetical protein
MGREVRLRWEVLPKTTTATKNIPYSSAVMPGDVCSEEAVRIGAEGMGVPKLRSLLSRSGGADG